VSLEIKAVSKSFNGSKRVLDAVSVSLPSKKFSGLLGPSGCGKTTLLRILAGLDKPDDGAVTLDGFEMLDMGRGVLVVPEKRNIGMVFQNYAVWPHMTVFENIAFPLKMRGTPKAQIRSEVDQALETVQLTGLGGRRSNELSGGQQQRVALARALVQKPRLLLLDEPLSNLDAHLRGIMRKEIRRLQADLGITAVIVTHDWEDASQICDRVVVLNNGKIEQEGSPAELLANPSSEFVRQLTRVRAAD
jgi:ABC-type Fe3+/spermidine/putrescine transport system ATPase subunit